MTVVCLQFEEPQNTQALAEIFYRATPQVMPRGDRFLFLEVSKCLNLYSLQTFLRRTMVTLRKIGIKARIGVGEDIPTALAFTVTNQDNKLDLPIEVVKYYFDPLDEQVDLAQKVRKMIELLKSLGIKTLQDFLRISIKEISSRFSTIGLLTYYRIRGESPVPWKAFTPAEVVVEKQEFDLESPVDNLEPVYFTLKAMVDKMTLRLRGRGKRARQFEVVLKQEHALNPSEQDYKVTVLLPLPYISNKVVLQVTREKIEAQVRAKPFKARITEYSLVVTEEVPYAPNQKNLFDQKREESEESFFRFISRMATKLGKHAVFFAKMRESYLPEKNWQRVEELEKPRGISAGLGASAVVGATARSLAPASPLPQRPLRLFSTPSTIHFWGQHVTWDGIVDEVVSLENREVVFSEWWENALERVYYRLETKAGRHLWLYRTAEGDFLHGEFD